MYSCAAEEPHLNRHTNQASFVYIHRSRNQTPTWPENSLAINTKEASQVEAGVELSHVQVEGTISQSHPLLLAAHRVLSARHRQLGAAANLQPRNNAQVTSGMIADWRSRFVMSLLRLPSAPQVVPTI